MRLTSCCWSGLDGTIVVVVRDAAGAIVVGVGVRVAAAIVVVVRETRPIVVVVRVGVSLAVVIVVGVCEARAVIVVVHIGVAGPIVVVVGDGVALCWRRGRGRSRHDLGLVHVQEQCHIGEQPPGAHLCCDGDRLRSKALSSAVPVESSQRCATFLPILSKLCCAIYFQLMPSHPLVR